MEKKRSAAYSGHSLSKTDRRTKNKRGESTAAFWLKLLLFPPVSGAIALFLFLLLFSEILTKSSDPEAFSNLCVLIAVFFSGGICGKIASEIAGKPFPWCIISCLVLAAIGMVLSYAAKFCPDTDRLFKGAVLFCSLLGSVCFSLPGSKKSRRPKH